MGKDLSLIEYVVIGTSAGGLDVLNTVLPAFSLQGKFKVFVVIHLPPSGPNLIPDLMNERCELFVKEAEPGEEIKENTIYIAPPDYHLCLEPNHILTLSAEGPVNFSRPSIDILFESAAYAYGKKVLGLLFTGANQDGADGLKKIVEAHGMAIVQKPEDAEYDVMPRSALEILSPDYVLTAKEISAFIKNLCEKGKKDAR